MLYMNFIYSFSKKSFLLLFVAMVSLFFSKVFSQVKSEWVHYDAKGKLVYKTTTAGDRIMDFSSAGYMGGGVGIPNVGIKITLYPIEGDNSSAIQKAIDEVAKMPVVKGFRGAVLLNPGTYNCEKVININASGIVLRGSGPDEKGTVINMTGKPHQCISVHGNVTSKVAGPAVMFSDAYVPAEVNELRHKSRSPTSPRFASLIMRTNPDLS